MGKIKIRCKGSDKEGVAEHFFLYDFEDVIGVPGIPDFTKFKKDVRKDDYVYLECDEPDPHTYKYYISELVKKTED